MSTYFPGQTSGIENTEPYLYFSTQTVKCLRKNSTISDTYKTDSVRCAFEVIATSQEEELHGEMYAVK